MIVKVKNISKKFGNFVAVDGISFEIGKGEIVGLLGPNGAGKTTTIHMLLDLITPSSGEIFVFNKNLKTHREEIMQHMNFTSPYVSLPYRLTVFENLMVFAGLYNVQDPKRKIDYLINLLGIDKLRNKPIAKLSSGENTKVGLCRALINNPKLLLLDEPTASLDPEASQEIRNILLKMRRENNSSILYTSHNMAEVEKICDRIIFLNHGKIIATGDPISITKSILKEERREPALEEVFLRVAKEGKNE